jgi:chemotaxis protein MotB
MRREKKHGEHDNSDRWLLTYADLITLLLGLFVILYAMSKIDAGKYAEIVSALGGVFGSPRGILTGEGSVLENPMTSLLSERQQISRQISTALNLDSQNLPISVSENERGVTVHIMEELLFASGSSEIKQASLPALDTLASILRRLPNDLRVEGHTDNVPINTLSFPSNWHLSVGRAVNVGYYLIRRHGLVAEKVSVVGYSEYRPLASNDKPEGRARNRRVDIVIVASGHGGNEPGSLAQGAGAARSAESSRINTAMAR